MSLLILEEKCKNCKHQTICKYLETFNEMEEKVNKMKEQYSETPIEIKVKCNYYKTRDFSLSR